MTGERDDRGLRDAFAKLRETDAASAPEFDQLLDQTRVRTRRPTRAGRGITWAAAMAMVLLLAVLVAVRTRRGAGEPTREEALAMAREISSWRAPTDSIAEISAPGLPSGVPTLDYTTVTLPGSLPGAAATARRSHQNR